MFKKFGAAAAVPRALLWALSLCSPAFAATKVVMISIDGLRGTTLSSIEQRHLQTPNLLQFVKGGAVADGLLGVFPTLTYPSHTTIVTGVAPDSHGIYGNSMFDPEHKFNGAQNSYAQQIKRPALWDVAHQAGLTTAAVGWPVTVGAAIDANFPSYPIRTKEEALLYRALCTPGLAAEFEKSTGTLLTANVTDETRTAMAVFLISTRKPDLLLVHLGDVDHQSHAHGPDSPEAYQAIEHIDSLIGRIREAVKTAEGNDDVDFVVVSDHGFKPVSRTLQPDAVLASLGLSAPQGLPEQWRVAAYSNGGSFGLIAHDANDAAGIQLAIKTFEEMEHEEGWGIQKIYTGAELKATGGYGDCFLAATLRDGFMAGGYLNGPWLTVPSEKGMHGYIPGDPNLDSAFVAYGKGIPAHRIGRHNLKDVAPTVAGLLNISFSDVQGEALPLR